MVNSKYIIIFLILFASGCKNSNNYGTEQTGQVHIVKTKPEKFTHPEPPAMITDPTLRLEYVVRHYWDYFDFADTSYIPTPEIAEQAWVNYIDLLFRLPSDKAQKEMKNMMSKSMLNSKKLFLYFAGLADKYLYEPNSPARNEELYITVLEVMIQSAALDDTEKIRPHSQLDWALKNRAGTKAADIQYVGVKGQTGTLYKLNTEFIILFFNDPECTSCKEHIENMRSSALIKRLLSEHKLCILSIYSESDEEKWEKNQTNYPSDWIIGYDPSFSIRSIYDLKASPTLYLLDKNKTVLLKDATLLQIEYYLNSHS